MNPAAQDEPEEGEIEDFPSRTAAAASVASNLSLKASSDGHGNSSPSRQPSGSKEDRNTSLPPSRVGTESVSRVEYDDSLRSTGKSILVEGGSERKSKTTILSSYGIPVTVETSGNFPSVGSRLGEYFCLGQLGKGTFSSIHKCICLKDNKVVAAKVELESFAQSGVLEAEATILDFLHRTLPPNVVPIYHGHYRSESDDGKQQYSAIVMEYLDGSDMHQLRESVKSRRINIKDAVFLCKDVMLPLLRQMHLVGIVHRDVKPSNVVRAAATTMSTGQPNAADFRFVDFGLSKSIILPQDSPHADLSHPWNGPWLRPQNYTGPGYVRQEREKAEFRGTSMYASVRVHQLKDYCPRDDLFSLMYVFCDLISGGLPWMSHAASRDRSTCQNLKEKVHGENGPEETALLLMGDEYHVAKFRRDRYEAAGELARLPELPEPLAMSKDPRLVGLLRKAFHHLQSLKFWEAPNYDLVADCINGFSVNADFENEFSVRHVRPIEWQATKAVRSPDHRPKSFLRFEKHPIPVWNFAGDADLIDSEVFNDIEDPLVPSVFDAFCRLPLELRYRISQMEYHASRPDSVPRHVALRDWMNIVLPLVYGNWDSPKYEGRNRTMTDGMKRELLLMLLRKCRDWAEAFGNFRSWDCIAELTGDDVVDSMTPKRRKIEVENGMGNLKPLVYVSLALANVTHMIKAEEAKRPAPPMSIQDTFD